MAKKKRKKVQYVCKTEDSDVLDKKVHVPYLKIGKKLIQPKFASLGEKEEYKTRKMCSKRIKKLNKGIMKRQK